MSGIDSENNTITLSVRQLRDLIAISDRTHFVYNYPYESGTVRRLELKCYGATEQGVPLLTFLLRENERTIRETTVSASEIFGLAENVRRIITARANEVPK